MPLDNEHHHAAGVVCLDAMANWIGALLVYILSDIDYDKIECDVRYAYHLNWNFIHTARLYPTKSPARLLAARRCLLITIDDGVAAWNIYANNSI